MSRWLMKERPLRTAFQDPHGQSHRAIDAALTGEPIRFAPLRDVDGQLRVLIVDDHRAIADTLSSLATLWGHDVRCAYDGVTGMALAAAFQPDVVLLDILMPTVTGLEVALQIRRQDRLKHCFIVAITGRTDAKHHCRCYEAGVDLVLTKPLVPSHVQTLLMLEWEHVMH